MNELETEDCSSQDGHTREVASSLGADSGSAVLRHLLWTQMAWRGFPGLPAPEQVGDGQGAVGGASARCSVSTLTATAVPPAHPLLSYREGLAGQKVQE